MLRSGILWGSHWLGLCTFTAEDPGSHVQSLVGELTSHQTQGPKKKKVAFLLVECCVYNK